ncbi:ubiquitin-associated protein 1 [Megalops cyprinoides]|uniref:ubiquitin-associated protein 1 n=1 Tax=Megalops cyprinoides TaxID=118141 RepID=UPI001863A107|nr:ubiquitin-associated protein 1 [Megalops cyprinoides]
MASRKSGSDIHNTGPISYLDDVPFKLNDKFRCPAKVGLPIGFCLPDCGTLFSEIHYDFSLEQRSVRWGEELAEARAAQERAEQRAEMARAESEGKDQQGAPQDKDSGPEGGPSHPSDEQDPPPPALNPVLAGLRHNAILTPLPAPSLGPVRHPSPPPPQSLNLADFEREEDPFDKLELKTLDDKEELRSILQVQSATPPEPAPHSRSCTPPPPAKPAVFHKPNGLVALLDLDRPAGGQIGQLDSDRPCNIRSLTFPKLSDPGDSHEEASSYTPAPARTLPNGTSLSLVRTPPQNNDIGRSQEPHNGAPKEPISLPAATQLPAPCVVSPPGGGTGHCGALLNLSPSERQCVETIVGMGYSYEGVLKAMQRQGQNVEQVLDYLFIHGRLCERGFDASAVEECLEMYQCSEEKALEFLQLMSRFGEMGFERDTIKEVLLVHNNDQDKALEDLMARAAAS